MIDKHVAEDLAAMRGHAWMAEVRPLCAYYRGVGICSFGCWEEPACHVDEPENGWEFAAYERWADLADTVRAVVREDRAELTHADVKHLRDRAREADRRAVRCLAAAGGAR